MTRRFVKSSKTVGIALMAAITGVAIVQEASAGVVVTVTDLGSLSDGVTTYAAFNAYKITLTSDSGVILAVNFGGLSNDPRGLFGPFLQRWAYIPSVLETPSPILAQAANGTAESMDSHFVNLPDGASLGPAALPSEDNDFVNPQGGPHDASPFDIGSGTFLTSTYAIIGIQPSRFTLAYVVLPTGETGFYSGSVATEGGTFDVSGSIGVPEPGTAGVLRDGRPTRDAPSSLTRAEGVRGNINPDLHRGFGMSALISCLHSMVPPPALFAGLLQRRRRNAKHDGNRNPQTIHGC